MNITIHDRMAMKALKPLEVASYLRSKGWIKSENIGDKASLWTIVKNGEDELDVTLPLKRELGDYALRMGEVINTLAETEERSSLEILSDIQSIRADVVRIRALGSQAEHGSLPLGSAIRLVESSRDMLLSAACAAVDKRPFFAKRKVQQAIDYINQVHMGQTERGSFVITILSPVLPELRQGQAPLPEIELPDPFERQVTKTLMNALVALDQAAKSASLEDSIEPFKEAVRLGVSANLCDSIVGLSQVCCNERVEIGMSWSPSRLVPNDIKNVIYFDADVVPVIKEAAKQFREISSIDDYDIEGVVTRLDRSPNATEGDVTVTASIEGRMRPITLRLGQDIYSQAVQAHNDRKTVQCIGELVKEGRGLRLRDPRHFRVLREDDYL